MMLDATTKASTCLKSEVALNGLANVYTYNVALGVTEEKVSAYSPDLTNFNFPSAIRVLDQFQPDAAVSEANLRYEESTMYLRCLRMKIGSFLFLFKDILQPSYHTAEHARGCPTDSKNNSLQLCIY